MHDLACVIHLHSTYSDGTGTVKQIARAGRRARADVVLLTDHDTLAAKRNGEEGWYGDVLLLVGTEVSPRRWRGRTRCCETHASAPRSNRSPDGFPPTTCRR